MIRSGGKLFLACLLLGVCSSYAFSQTQIRLKLADGSYMDVDEATETPQGVWYRKGPINQLLPKDKVKKIERDAPAPAPVKSTNEDDHFEVADRLTHEPAQALRELVCFVRFLRFQLRCARGARYRIVHPFTCSIVDHATQASHCGRHPPPAPAP